MNGHERFLSSPQFKALSEGQFATANRAWFAMAPQYRAFLAKQAKLDPSRGDVPLHELTQFERQALHEANARIVELAVSARGPLLSAVLNAPPLPARKAA